MSPPSEQPMIQPSATPANVGILIFPEMEVLDFAGPFEVFSVAARIAHKAIGLETPPFQVFTIAKTREPVFARHGLQITPEFGFNTCPALDILIVPGGVMDAALASKSTLNWVKHQAQHVQLTASVCTGAFVLAELGLLNGLTATTHWEHIEEMRRDFAQITVVEDVPFVDQGRIATSAGIAAGIEMSLHLVGRLMGLELAQATARQMQYTWDAR